MCKMQKNVAKHFTDDCNAHKNVAKHFTDGCSALKRLQSILQMVVMRFNAFKALLYKTRRCSLPKKGIQ